MIEYRSDKPLYPRSDPDQSVRNGLSAVMTFGALIGLVLCTIVLLVGLVLLL